MDDDVSFNYLAGVEVSGFSGVPPHAPFAGRPQYGPVPSIVHGDRRR
jgi:hypothetical protein